MVNVVDSYSRDATPSIARSHGVQLIFYKGKLLGARYEGVIASYADYVLFMDSDQVLAPGSLARLLDLLEEKSHDMVILEEGSYRTRTLTEKMYNLDRALVHDAYSYNVSPERGVLMPRVFKRALLLKAFESIDPALLPVVTAHDHAIIYYECCKLSSDIALLPKAMFHQEPPTLRETFHHFVSYGRNVRSFEDLGAYEDLIRSKMKGRNAGVLKALQPKRVLTLPLLLAKYAGYHYGHHQVT
jgi:glycosyltransferase involved in cell wall biosynthesis